VLRVFKTCAFEIAKDERLGRGRYSACWADRRLCRSL